MTLTILTVLGWILVLAGCALFLADQALTIRANPGRRVPLLRADPAAAQPRRAQQLRTLAILLIVPSGTLIGAPLGSVVFPILVAVILAGVAMVVVHNRQVAAHYEPGMIRGSRRSRRHG